MKRKFYIVVQGSDDGELSTPSENAYSTREEAIDAALRMINKDVDFYCINGSDETDVLERARQELEEENCAYCNTEGGTDIFQICAVQVPINNKEYESVRLSDYDIVKQTIKAQGITQRRINSLYPKQFLESFLDFDGDAKGYCLLCCMGHYYDGIPFDVEQFLSTGQTSWTDGHDNPVTMSFKLKRNMIYFHVSYRGVENDTESEIDDEEDYTPAQFCKMQSEYIGEDCVDALDEIFPYNEYPFPEEIDDGSDE